MSGWVKGSHCLVIGWALSLATAPLVVSPALCGELAEAREFPSGTVGPTDHEIQPRSERRRAMDRRISDEMIRAAQDSWVIGVKSIDLSDLRVVRPTPGAINVDGNPRSLVDDIITEKVLNALSSDPRLGRPDLHVEVQDGLVTLSGLVNSLHAKQAAEQDAKEIQGVANVDNLLNVHQAQWADDPGISVRVINALHFDPHLHPDDIRVAVSKGIVSLAGSVETADEKSRAEEVASRARGVLRVQNHLSVRSPWVKNSDEEIKREIETIWQKNKFMNKKDITVNVKDGVATLAGQVDTWDMRHVLGEMASEGGAKRVHNELKVRFGNGGHPHRYPSPSGEPDSQRR